MPGVYSPEQAEELAKQAASPVEGTPLPESAPKTAGIPVSPPEEPPGTAKIADLGKQGVTPDAQSASPVHLAARSVPSQSGNSANSGAGNAAPTVANKATGQFITKSNSTGITVRVTPEQDKLIELEKPFHGGSKAAVLLDAFLNGKVPEVNHQLREHLLDLMRVLNGLIERANQNDLPAELKPLLAKISQQILQLREDLVKPHKPNATDLAMAGMARDIEILKKQNAIMMEILAQKGTS